MLDLLARADAAPDSVPPGVNMTLAASYKTCEEINEICTIERTILGYYPNAGINYFFAIGFGTAGLASLIFGTWKRTWSFMAYLTAGCMLELAGAYIPSLIHLLFVLERPLRLVYITHCLSCTPPFRLHYSTHFFPLHLP